MKLFPTTAVLLFLMLLLSANEIGPRKVEAKLCQYKSRTFFGVCVSGNTCNQKCQGEAFDGGRCHGVRRQCCCYRTC
ncbi:defensin-like protein 1 [Nicotiana tabacum]|uniref:Defensin-like protein 1 n=1 Tax=Nicotiana tabacum TaxID=4097 RepID=A0A1S3XDM8_TOBAC